MTPNIYTYVTHVVVGVTHTVVAVIVTPSVVPFLQIQFPNSDPPIGLSLVETH